MEFRKLAKTTAINQPRSTLPQVQLWIPPASKQQAEDQLFHFLCSIHEGRPQAGTPLLLDEKTLHALYTDPHPTLIKALRHSIDLFLTELGPDPTCWEQMDLPVTLLGVLLATYDCLCPPALLSLPGEETEDPVLTFVSALIKTLPPARTLSDMLAYHALLRHAAEAFPTLAENRAVVLHVLLNRSPLSSLYYLDLCTPSPLPGLASEILPWKRKNTVQPAPWKSLDDWLQRVEELLSKPAIAVFLRQRWLSLPETHRSCYNLGLVLEGLRLLEELRRQGNLRTFILEFYEAYAFFSAQKVNDVQNENACYWPLLEQIERLVRTQGEDESMIPTHINRLGNEYFLKFLALVNIISIEGSPPRNYYQLTVPFIGNVKRLMPYITLKSSIANRSQTAIEFISEDKQ